MSFASSIFRTTKLIAAYIGDRCHSAHVASSMSSASRQSPPPEVIGVEVERSQSLPRGLERQARTSLSLSASRALTMRCSSRKMFTWPPPEISLSYGIATESACCKMLKEVQSAWRRCLKHASLNSSPGSVRRPIVVRSPPRVDCARPRLSPIRSATQTNVAAVLGARSSAPTR